MCMFLFVSPQIQSQEAPSDNTRVHVDTGGSSASCNGCTTTYYEFSEWMTIDCGDSGRWSGSVPDFNGTACGEKLT